MPRFYTIKTRRVMKLLKNKSCRKCGGPFLLGDKVIATYRSKQTVRYHEDCYNATLH